LNSTLLIYHGDDAQLVALDKRAEGEMPDLLEYCLEIIVVNDAVSRQQQFTVHNGASSGD